MTVITIDYAITVASGSGDNDTPTVPMLVVRSARINNICVNAPNATCTYDLTIEDEDGYVIYYETGITGDSSTICDRLCKDKINIKISNATSDGAYAVRLYMES